MITSSDLYDLIHSLSKNEKGYFKKINQQQDKYYVKLFDILNQLKPFDESKFQKKVKSKDFAKKGQLHVHKNYLYHLILRTLQLYAEKKSHDIHLFGMLSQARLLEDKGLLKQSYKLLLKAREVALKSHKTWVLIEIEKRIALQQINHNNSDLINSLENISNSLESLQHLLGLETRLSICRYKLFSRIRLAQDSVDNTSIIDKAKNILSDLVIIPESSFHLRQLSSQIKWGIAFHEGNFQKAHDSLRETVQIWEAFPQMILENPKKFKIQVFNYASSCIRIQQTKKIPLILDKISNISSVSLKDEAQTFQCVSYLKLVYCLNNLELELADQLIDKIEVGLVKYENKINTASLLTLLYNVAILFFIKEEFHKALDWITKVISYRKHQPRMDLQVFATVLELIIHYELNNFRILPDMYRSAQRFIKKNAPDSPYLETVLKLIKALISGENQRERKAFNEFQQAISYFKASRAKYTGIEEVDLWTKSKIEKTTILELIKQDQNQIEPINS